MHVGFWRGGSRLRRNLEAGTARVHLQRGQRGGYKRFKPPEIVRFLAHPGT